MAKTAQQPDPASDLARKIRSRRREEKMTVSELSRRARVGSSSVVTLEKLSRRQASKLTPPRKLRTWTRVLAQVGLTLQPGEELARVARRTGQVRRRVAHGLRDQRNPRRGAAPA